MMNKYLNLYDAILLGFKDITYLIYFSQNQEVITQVLAYSLFG